jgi:protein-tyrosine-phosphatase
MTRFRESKQHRSISAAISSALSEYSLNLIRADQKQYRPELWQNVRCCMDAALYGIAVFEQIDERDINPNVSLELGYMLGQGKRCLLLKERRVPALPTDLIGRLYREFDSFKIRQTIQAEIRSWLRDLGIAKRGDERMLIYMSHGGTCRCAMAKAISQKLLAQTRPHYKLRIESVAYGLPSGDRASGGARQAVRNMFGEDLLKDHRTMMRSRTILDEADLILVMDRSLLKRLPAEKTYVFKPYVGLSGDVEDPWPDEGDEASAVRYARCAEELRRALEIGMTKIIDALRP